MNPASTGGGRKQLSPSVESLFCRIVIEPYGAHELLAIARSLFRDLEERKVLQESEVMDAIEAFMVVNELLEQHRITGELNLRDLFKLRELLRECLVSAQQKEELRGDTVEEDLPRPPSDAYEPPTYSPTPSPGALAEQNATLASTGVSTKLLFEYIRAVFVERFRSASDREVLLTGLRNYPRFASRPEAVAVFEPVSTVSAATKLLVTHSVVQIGDVHLERSVAQPDSSTNPGSATAPQLSPSQPFVYTARALHNLKRIAAPVTAHRPSLVVGPSCSAKTATIVEVARLCNKRLLVIGGQDELDVSDLIGAVSPDRESALNQICREIDAAFSQCIRVLCEPRTQTRAGELVATLAHAIEVFDWENHSKTGLRAKKLDGILADLHGLAVKLSKDTSVSRSVSGTLSGVQQRLKHCQLRAESVDWRPSFTFEESRFVQALRQGEWVLFENINTVQQEVVERLLSMLEERPMLDLYESGRKTVLKLASAFEGEQISDPIHPDFRLFFTADLDRTDAFDLSAAFVSRLNQVPLECLENDSEPILLGVCEALLGHKDLGVVTAVQEFHKHCVETERKNLSELLISNSRLSFRAMLQVMSVTATLCRSFGFSTGDALATALIQTYITRTAPDRQTALKEELVHQITANWPKKVSLSDAQADIESNLSADVTGSKTLRNIAATMSELECTVALFACGDCDRHSESGGDGVNAPWSTHVKPFVQRLTTVEVVHPSDVRFAAVETPDAAGITKRAAVVANSLPRLMRNARLDDWRLRREYTLRVAYSARMCAQLLHVLPSGLAPTSLLLECLAQYADVAAQRFELIEHPAEVAQLRRELQESADLKTVRQTFDQLVFTPQLAQAGCDWLIRFAQNGHGIIKRLPLSAARTLSSFVRSYAAVAHLWRIVSEEPLPAPQPLVELLGLYESALLAANLLGRAVQAVVLGDRTALDLIKRSAEMSVLRDHSSTSSAACSVASSCAQLRQDDHTASAVDVVASFVAQRHRDIFAWHGARDLLDCFAIRFALGVAYLRANSRLSTPMLFVTWAELPNRALLRARLPKATEFDVVLFCGDSGAAPRVTVFRLRNDTDVGLRVFAVYASDPITPDNAAGIARNLLLLESVEDMRVVAPEYSAAHPSQLIEALASSSVGTTVPDIDSAVNAIRHAIARRVNGSFDAVQEQQPGILQRFNMTFERFYTTAADLDAAETLHGVTVSFHMNLARLVRGMVLRHGSGGDMLDGLRSTAEMFPYATCMLAKDHFAEATDANVFVQDSIVSTHATRVAAHLAHVVVALVSSTTSPLYAVPTPVVDVLLDIDSVLALEQIHTSLCSRVPEFAQRLPAVIAQRGLQECVSRIFVGQPPVVGRSDMSTVMSDLADEARRVVGRTYVADPSAFAQAGASGGASARAPAEEEISVKARENREVLQSRIKELRGLKKDCDEHQPRLYNLSTEISLVISALEEENVDGFENVDWKAFNERQEPFKERFIEVSLCLKNIAARAGTAHDDQTVPIVELPAVPTLAQSSDRTNCSHIGLPAGEPTAFWTRQYLPKLLESARRLRTRFSATRNPRRHQHIYTEFADFRDAVLMSELAHLSYGDIASNMTHTLDGAQLPSMLKLHSTLVHAVRSADQALKLDELHDAKQLHQPMLLSPLLPLVADIVSISCADADVLKVFDLEVQMSELHITGMERLASFATELNLTTPFEYVIPVVYKLLSFDYAASWGGGTGRTLVHQHPRFRLAVLAVLALLSADLLIEDFGKATTDTERRYAVGARDSIRDLLRSALTISSDTFEHLPRVLESLLVLSNITISHERPRGNSDPMDAVEQLGRCNDSRYSSRTKRRIATLLFSCRGIRGAIDDIVHLRSQEIAAAAVSASVEARVESLTGLGQVSRVQQPSASNHEAWANGVIRVLLERLSAVLSAGELPGERRAVAQLQRTCDAADLQLFADMAFALADESCAAEQASSQAKRIAAAAKLVCECIESELNPAWLKVAELETRLQQRIRRVRLAGCVTAAFGLDFGLDTVAHRVRYHMCRVSKYAKATATRGATSHARAARTLIDSIASLQSEVLEKVCTQKEHDAFSKLAEALRGLFTNPPASAAIEDLEGLALCEGEGREALKELESEFCTYRNYKARYAYFDNLRKHLEDVAKLVRNATIEATCRDGVRRSLHTIVVSVALDAAREAHSADGSRVREIVCGASCAAHSADVALERLLTPGVLDFNTRETLRKQRTAARIVLFAHSVAVDAVCSSSFELSRTLLPTLIEAPRVFLENRPSVEELCVVVDKLLGVRQSAVYELQRAVDSARQELVDGLTATAQ
eukprot:Hpha_TRINITY_DN16396_c1_g1::TRINITY_DN16396_c1_g1_i1::g.60969::m.60969